ncbi:MAG: FAD-binding oxidoreductase [Deltaproteobacteria bacterium]|nr:FAD-binding oxidoreductase [Deltaproteobacteria bacterium]
MPTATVGIIGAGFAGAATAYFLTRAGVSDVVILEQEDQPGTHASGNNAAMARQFVLDPEIRRMAIRGTNFLYSPATGLQSFIRPVGSLLLFDGPMEDAIRQTVEEGHSDGLPSTVIRRAECESRQPFLKDADFTGAVWTPTDGAVDTHAYLSGLLKAAQAGGAQVITAARVRALRAVQGGWEVGVNGTTWKCQSIVNAAGAWADQIATLAGAHPRGLVALRRHLFQSVPMPDVDPSCPFAWDTAHEFYFRPESGGLILCACDEEQAVPGSAMVNPRIAELLAEKLRRHCPRLADIAIAKSWAGLRTFAPDRKFVLGWDGQAPSFYWVAGLGGHGVTCAAAVGEQATADIIRCLT